MSLGKVIDFGCFRTARIVYWNFALSLLSLSLHLSPSCLPLDVDTEHAKPDYVVRAS